MGVAPAATLHPVRVLGCDGGGRASDVVAGLEWTAAHVAATRAAVAPYGGTWPSVVGRCRFTLSNPRSERLEFSSYKRNMANRFQNLVQNSTCGATPW